MLISKHLMGKDDYYDRLWREMKAKYRVLCLSAIANNILMRSHYAESHQGVVLGFEPKIECKSGLTAAQARAERIRALRIMSFERRRDWNRDSLPGLTSLDSDFVSGRVDIVPAQSCQIGQALAGVEPEEDQASPLFIG